MELELAALAILLALSAFFSAAEAAILSINRVRLRYIMQKNKWSPRAKTLSRLKSSTMKTIMTILLANNIVTISASFIVAHATETYFGDLYLALSFGILTFIIVVFGEIIPKNYGTNNAEKFGLFAAQPIELLSMLLSPLVFVLDYINRIVPGVYPIPGQKIGMSEDEMKSVFEVGVEDMAITHDEKQLLERVLDFNDTYLKEIMTHKRDVKFVKATENRDELLRQVSSQKKSQYPVIDESNKVVGILTVKKFLSAKPAAALRELLEPPFFVSREMVASELFKKMQKSHVRMAVVLDSEGRMDGIVTLEDLLEELVGEISSQENMQSADAAAKAADDASPTLAVSGESRLHDVEKELKIQLPESERFGSVAAYIHHQLKRIPVRGDVILLPKCRIEIREMDKDFRIIKAEVSRLQ